MRDIIILTLFLIAIYIIILFFIKIIKMELKKTKILERNLKENINEEIICAMIAVINRYSNEIERRRNKKIYKRGLYKISDWRMAINRYYRENYEKKI